MRTRVVLVAVIACLWATAGAQASGIVYDNGNPELDDANGVIDDWVAADFVLGGPTLVTDFHWYYADYDGIGDAGPLLGWAILDDNGGAPGSVLASGVGTNIVTSLYCAVCWNEWLDIYEQQFDLDSPVLLSAGDYWFAISLYTYPFGQLYLWTQTTPGYGSFYYHGDTLDALAGGAFDVAFQVTGTPVPEPATLLLLGTGLGAVAARRRLKKRA